MKYNTFDVEAIQDYIKKATDAGFVKEEIIKKLRKAGWSNKSINAVYDIRHSKPSRSFLFLFFRSAGLIILIGVALCAVVFGVLILICSF